MCQKAVQVVLHFALLCAIDTRRLALNCHCSAGRAEALDMPSKKKAKGKARKAAKAAEATRKEDEIARKEAEVAAAAAQKESVLVTQLNRLHLTGNETCTHGYETDDTTGICGDFAKHFLDLVAQVPCKIPFDRSPHGSSAMVSMVKFPQVWNNDRVLAKIDSLFLALGTNYILSGDIDIDRVRQCASSASFIVSLIQKDIVATTGKITELFVADEHTLVRYLQKRIPCSCLDEKYEEVKDMKKIGLCCNPQCKLPGNVAERTSMLCCSRCRLEYYCSRECQAAHWRAGHKEACEERRIFRKAAQSGEQVDADVLMSHFNLMVEQGFKPEDCLKGLKIL